MSGTTEAKLVNLAAGQWGMVTAAQATADGVARSTLTRRERSGTLDRVRSGVYRIPGAPANRLDEIRAAWLAADPHAPAWERLDSPDVVVGGAAAAWAHEIGDLYPSPYLLYTGTRRQTKHDDVRYSTRRIPREDVVVIDGLPVTTRERTIADLLNEPGADVSIVADAFRDAERADSDFDTERLISHLDARAKRLGYVTGSGLYRRLRELSRVDEERYRDLVANTDMAQRINVLVEQHMRDILAPLREQMEKQVQDALAPILRARVPPITFPAIALPKVTLPPDLFPKVILPPDLLANITSPSVKAMLDRAAQLTSSGSSRTAPAEEDSES